jgi:hypothetical protein
MKFYWRVKNIPELSGLPLQLAHRIQSDCHRRHSFRDPLYWSGLLLLAACGFATFYGTGFIADEFGTKGDTRRFLQIIFTFGSLCPALLYNVHQQNKRYRPYYAQAVASLKTQSATESVQTPQLNRHQANVLYALSAIVIFFGSILLVGFAHHFGKWIVYFTLAASYLCGGGTLYLLLHWRDTSWRKKPKLNFIHGFNLLSSFGILLGFPVAFMIRHYLLH